MTRIAHPHRLILALALLAGSLLLPVPDASAGSPQWERILFLASEDSGPHQSIFGQIHDVPNGRMVYAALGHPDTEAWLSIWDCHRCLVITSGTRSLNRALPGLSEAHILSITIPRQSFELAVQTHGDTDRLAAIFMDIPLEQRMAIAREVLPGINRLALIEGPSRASPVEGLASHESNGATGVERFVSYQENDLIRTFARASERADAILTVPDRRVYNPRTIVSIVMTTYRHRTPLIAHSESLLRAGALISIHATPEQLGKEAAMLLQSLESGQPQWSAQRHHTERHEVAINPYVARSLRIQVAP
ncbi:ABC transporter substrate-binding protein [Ectothiorhodospira sp. BSL-9]|uniref:ABC transporter substrate-binding protein n=1 Tax=Ectothiorhodospira sp. BSL-9 TaxID=1442136 RepID=UPI0007B442B4|nr:ABC transporter substrate binding protein [Ectothiorhodospira sp. BSL-9]ANB02904.1 hypothetical protein ECTOBSL9_2424 [Ectothiorhodospira sp. BSL-9]